MINVEVIRTENALMELKEAWTNLLADMSNPSIFLTWEWITTWWRHYGQDNDLNVLAARDENGEVMGIAPLMLTKTGWGPLALRRLVFIGAGIAYPAHLDIIVKSDDKQAVSRAFLSFLTEHQGEWDLLELVSLAENSPLESQLNGAGGHHNEGYSMPCPYILLPDDWETYQEKHISSSLRKNIAYHLRRIKRDFPDQVVFEQVSNAEQVAEALAALQDMHIQRWSSQGQTTPFESARYMAFHEDFATTALENDWLRLSVLRVGDEIAAVNYCFRYGDVYYGYQRAYSANWYKHSPGRLLMAYIIESAIEEGVRELDMLHGAAGSKGDWSESVRFDDRIRFSHNIKGDVVLLGATLLDNVVSASREHLPASVRQRVSRFVPMSQW